MVVHKAIKVQTQEYKATTVFDIEVWFSLLKLKRQRRQQVESIHLSPQGDSKIMIDCLGQNILSFSFLIETKNSFFPLHMCITTNTFLRRVLPNSSFILKAVPDIRCKTWIMSKAVSKSAIDP